MMEKSKVLNSIFLPLFTLGGCIVGACVVLFGAMFMVTEDFTWFYMAPVGIIVVDLFSIPAYRYVLAGVWRYVYNASVTLLVTVICFYGAIEWVETIHGSKGTLGLHLGLFIGVSLSILGMVISRKISRRKREEL
ncbi:hypothetical protein ACFL5X_03255 [Candidatus Omnitrophota bacterium]